MQSLCVFLVLGFAFVSCQVYTGPTWQGKTKQTKASDLWNATMGDTTSNDWPGLGILQLFIESMDTTMDTVGDDMPRQVLGLQRRPKLVHTVGAVALAVWEPLKGHNYSGVFAGGVRRASVLFTIFSAPTCSFVSLWLLKLNANHVDALLELLSSASEPEFRREISSECSAWKDKTASTSSNTTSLTTFLVSLFQ